MAVSSNSAYSSARTAKETSELMVSISRLSAIMAQSCGVNKAQLGQEFNRRLTEKRKS